MGDFSKEQVLAILMKQAVTCWLAATSVAREWGEERANAVLALIGSGHRGEIEALRDAALHHAALEPWAAAVARDLAIACRRFADAETTREECVDIGLDEDGENDAIHRWTRTSRSTVGDNAASEGMALMNVAKAIEQCVDLDVALARYGFVPG